jgi:hypothetical protein
MTCPFIRDRMIKVRPGHGIEECGVSLAFFVVFSEVAEGVQIFHVSDPTIDGAVGCSCAILNSSGRGKSGCLRRAEYGDEGLQDEDRGKMLLNDCQQSLHSRAVDADRAVTHSGASGTFIGVAAHPAGAERPISAIWL